MILILASLVHYTVFLYTVLIAVRIIASWFPKAAYHPIIFFISRITDPYLNLFRRLIPPIGGRLDLSPMLAFLGLNLVEKFLMMLFLR
ncbi:MAG: YggT family protein [Simkania sp.]|nr:YggT family protein [Simkania sp.]